MFLNTTGIQQSIEKCKSTYLFFKLEGNHYPSCLHSLLNLFHISIAMHKYTAFKIVEYLSRMSVTEHDIVLTPGAPLLIVTLWSPVRGVVVGRTMSSCWSIHHFHPDWNVWNTIGWITMRFATVIQVI